MDSIIVSLVMLLAVVVSSWIVRWLPPVLPLPLIQIGLGAIIGLTATYRVSLAPDVFFLLFLPPLLFVDAWRSPRDALLREGWPVIQLAVGLVVFTVLGVGFAIHWMVPSMPLAVAFALAAVLSPTDAVAVSSIADRCAFPPRLLTILSGEALLNDASGLVCLRFAVAAALTGTFSLTHAIATFFIIAIGGIAIGIATTLVVAWVKDAIAARVGENPTNQILVSLLIPFMAYLLAEELGVSGVLAAVVAGLAMNYIESRGRAMALTRVRRRVVWDTVQVALNGMIFVLLGEQLPAVVEGAAHTAAESGHSNRVWLLVYIGAIGAGLHLTRFLWVWASMWADSMRRRRPVASPPSTDWRLMTVGTVAGVRGAVTFAGVLTLPTTLADGTALPGRDLAICLAAGIIIVSLLIADVLLPRLLGSVEFPVDDLPESQETNARAEAAVAAIQAIEQARDAFIAPDADGKDVTATAARIVAFYRTRLAELSRERKQGVDTEANGEIARKLRIAALQAERRTILQLASSHAIDQTTGRKLFGEIDLAEAVQRDLIG